MERIFTPSRCGGQVAEQGGRSQRNASGFKRRPRLGAATAGLLLEPCLGAPIAPAQSWLSAKQLNQPKMG
jgi:hypothetical protein